MKKTILILLTLILMLNTVNGYNYSGKEYNIYIPENIEYMEYCYNSGQCEVPYEFQKLIYINILLIKYGHEPLY